MEKSKRPVKERVSKWDDFLSPIYGEKSLVLQISFLIEGDKITAGVPFLYYKKCQKK